MMKAWHWALMAVLVGPSAAFLGCEGETGQETTDGAGANAGTGTSTSSSSAMGGGGSAPIVCTTQYTNVPMGDCDLLNQDCPPGQTCRPIFEQAAQVWTTKCRNASGLKGAGKTCITDDECDAGLFCVPGPPDLCSPVCCPDQNEQQTCLGGSCDVEYHFVNDAQFMLMCGYDPQCKLFDPNSCPPNSDCHVSDTSQGLVTCTAPSGANAGDGDPCMYRNDCQDMQHCFVEASQAVCRFYCYLMPPDPPPAPGLGGCPVGQQCASVSLGIAGIGVCTIP